MKIKRINKTLHKWLSIPLGIILFVICITGAMLVFQKEILELSNPHHYRIKKVSGNPIPLDRLIPMVNAQLEDNSVASVEVSKEPNKTYKMSLTEGFRVTAFVNQYTGEVVGQYAVREHAFFSIMSMHRWLMDGTRTWGKYIVGWSTLLFVFIVITGFFYRNKRSKDNYVIHFNKGTKRMIFGLHNTLGVYASLVLIICALSGLMWSFDWFRNGVFTVFGAPAEEQQSGNNRRGGDGKKEKATINYVSWQSALENVLAEDSDYDYVKISNGAVSAHPDNTYRTRVQDKITFDKNTGEIKKTVLFEDQDVKSRVWAWAYSLHVGDYWGIWSKILTFIVCLIGASLPITGYYMTIKRWKEKRRKR